MRPKAQCTYCRQPNYIDELVCRFCGGPLPMAAIPSIQEGAVEMAYYGVVASTGLNMMATQMSTYVPPSYFEVLKSRQLWYVVFLGGYLLTQALNA